ncbi:MAG: hypothetical protein KAQ98_06180 [Bacteriovoracaceae bacterium]|nr:hypothetical protein [Bacteriovoracaceae bacterium]
MKILKMVILPMLMLLLASCIGGAGSFKIENFGGSGVNIVRDGNSLMPQTKAGIKNSDILDCGEYSWMIASDGKNVSLKLGPSSKLTMELEKTPDQSLNLIKGDLFVDYKKSLIGGRKIIVEDDVCYFKPFGNARFFVMKSPGNTTRMIVLSGAVLYKVKYGGPPIKMITGDGIQIDSKGQTSGPGKHSWVKYFDWSNIISDMNISGADSIISNFKIKSGSRSSGDSSILGDKDSTVNRVHGELKKGFNPIVSELNKKLDKMEDEKKAKQERDIKSRKVRGKKGKAVAAPGDKRDIFEKLYDSKKKIEEREQMLKELDDES